MADARLHTTAWGLCNRDLRDHSTVASSSTAASSRLGEPSTVRPHSRENAAMPASMPWPMLDHGERAADRKRFVAQPLGVPFLDVQVEAGQPSDLAVASGDYAGAGGFAGKEFLIMAEIP